MERIVFLERNTIDAEFRRPQFDHEWTEYGIQDIRDGKWQQAKQFCLLNHTIHDLHGSTIGIIGYGSLGKAVAALAGSIGMQVLVAERKSSERSW
jgi:lactate dehydrogenase-like 2-hydroxyacid dehydrogenase